MLSLNQILPCDRRWSDEDDCWQVYGGVGVWISYPDFDDPNWWPVNYKQLEENNAPDQ